MVLFSRLKKHFTNKIIIGIFLICSLALVSYRYSSNNSQATVDQKQGLYIFILSKPVAEYEYLGSVKKSVAWSGQPEEMLNSIIKKVKKDYPKANGLIFTTLAMDQADAIEFKEK